MFFLYVFFDRPIQTLKRRVSNRYALYYLMSGLVVFRLPWSDRICHIMCSSTRADYIFPNIIGALRCWMNIGRQLHIVIVCYISPPNFGALTPRMDGKYNFNHFIARYCNITRALSIRLSDSANKNKIYYPYRAPPYSMTCIRLWFFFLISRRAGEG